MCEKLICHFQASLDQIASKKTKEWWEKYLRNVILFRGVGIPEIRERLAQWRLEYNIVIWDKQEQLSIALKLFESPIAEDKLAGILFLQEYFYDQFEWEDLLPDYVQLYVKELIFDWNTCDWFCVRVLGPTIAKNGLPFAEAMTLIFSKSVRPARKSPSRYGDRRGSICNVAGVVAGREPDGVRGRAWRYIAAGQDRPQRRNLFDKRCLQPTYLEARAK